MHMPRHVQAYVWACLGICLGMPQHMPRGASASAWGRLGVRRLAVPSPEARTKAHRDAPRQCLNDSIGPSPPLSIRDISNAAWGGQWSITARESPKGPLDGPSAGLHGGAAHKRTEEAPRADPKSPKKGAQGAPRGDPKGSQGGHKRAPKKWHTRAHTLCHF